MTTAKEATAKGSVTANPRRSAGGSKAVAEALGRSSKSAATAEGVVKDVTLTLGDYQIILKGSTKEAIGKLIRNGDELIMVKDFEPIALPAIAGQSKKIDAVHHAHIETLKTYHEATGGLVNGLVDINALIEHPYNALIYGENEKVDDLVELFQKEDAQVFELIVNPYGQVLAGNRRLKAAKIVNDQQQKESTKDNPLKFEFLPVKVQSFDSVQAEFKYMILHNKSRQKTKAQIAREVKALIELAEANANPTNTRLSGGASTELSKEMMDAMGTSRATTFRTKRSFETLKNYKDRELAAKLEEYAVTVSKKAEDIIMAQPPSGVQIGVETYQRTLLDKAEQYPTASIKRLKGDLDKSLLAQQILNETPAASDTHKANEGESTSKDSEADTETKETEAENTEKSQLKKLIETQRSLGDKPTDNRKTPLKYINLALDAMRNIDLDAFAMITDPEYVPATRAYTILDDGFSQPHNGKVFANPPFSKASAAISLFNNEIAIGNTKQLFLILPASVQSTKAFHSFIKAHNPIVLIPERRLEFEPGELLILEDPEATAQGNREPSMIVFWSDNDDDYAEFADSGKGFGWIGKRYAPFNPFELPALFASIEWNVDKGNPDRLSANVFGVTADVFKDGETYEFRINGSGDGNPYPTLQTAKYIAIMSAIAALAPATPF